MSFDVVVPTAGRNSLQRLLRALAAGTGPLPERVLVVDDRHGGQLMLPPALSGLNVEVLRGHGRGPAAARNVGWRAAAAEWVAFLDDDVVPSSGWRAALVRDLRGLPPSVAGSQGRIAVPLPRDRRPGDWERNVAGLEGARWATADMAYRRKAIEAVGGFDERFERAYREDADLGLRLTAAGYEIAAGRRRVLHPVRAASAAASLRLQAGNADDVLMRALHGRDWRRRAGAPRGRLRRHLAVTAAALAAPLLLCAGRRRAAVAAAAGWLAGTAELCWARIAPGPRTAHEVRAMLWTSALLPPAASMHWVRGHARRGRLLRDGARAPRPAATPPAAGPRDRDGGPVATATPPAAVLLDRDGTLVEDVPYNGDPARVRLMPGARRAVERLRSAGLSLAVVSNQSGIGRGLVAPEEVEAVNRRIEDLLGPLGPWLVCPHVPDAGCGCRKPRPGLVLDAARRLGVRPERCALIGDIGSDVEAARAAGARPVIVPTPRTRAEEVRAAPQVAADLPAAVELLLAGREAQT